MILRHTVRAAQGSVQKYTEQMVTFVMISEGIYFWSTSMRFFQALKDQRNLKNDTLFFHKLNSYQHNAIYNLKNDNIRLGF